jgi:uncharacterized protein (DUF924 family)
MKPNDVLDFWFSDEARPSWFVKSDRFDAEVRARLGKPFEAAASGGLDDWREEPRPCLALVILLDQVPRNLFRGTPRSFATDALALATAELAVGRGYDEGLTPEERVFLYLPFEHCEDIAIQRRSVELFRRNVGPGMFLDYAQRHLDVVERFGRFPHRNQILGRRSTEEELEFLKQPGSAF